MWGRLRSPRWGRGALGIAVGALVLATGGAAGPAMGWSAATTMHSAARGSGSGAADASVAAPYRSLPPSAVRSSGALLAAPDTHGTRHHATDASTRAVHAPVVSQAVVVTALAQSGIPVVALRAYRAAQADLHAADPGCHLPWTLLAAIGRVESNHGRFAGAALLADGQSRPPIIGIALDGGPGIARIPDTDGGRYDGDPFFDHAVGAMQFLPSTWQRVAIDGNGDGVATPMDIFDAAPAAGAYLCAGGRDLTTHSGLQAAVFSYNHSRSYVDMVLALKRIYDRGGSGATLPVVTVPATAMHVKVPKKPLPPATSGAPPGVPTRDHPSRPTGSTQHPTAPSKGATGGSGGATSPKPTPVASPSPSPSGSPSGPPSGPPTSPASPTGPPSGSPSPPGAPTGSPQPPAAPVPALPGPVQVGMAAGQLTATWHAPQTGATADRYRAVLRRDHVAVSHTLVAAGHPLTVQWGGLAAGHRYTVSVQAGNSTGFGAARRSTTVMPTVPAPVTSVLVTGAGSKLTLSFAAPSSDGGLPITGYRIALYRDGARGRVSARAVTGTAPVVSGNLQPGAAYHYVITAKNSAGAGPAVVSNHVLLLAPRHVAVSTTAGGSTVTWKAPTAGPAVTGYLLFVLTKDGTPALPEVRIDSADARTYTLHDLPAGHSYVVQLTAVYGPDSRTAVAESAPFDVP